MSMLFYCILIMLASMAGLMGFGFGFSILSAIEIVYFMTIRWIFHRYNSPNETPPLPDPTHEIIDPISEWSENSQKCENPLQHDYKDFLHYTITQ